MAYRIFGRSKKEEPKPEVPAPSMSDVKAKTDARVAEMEKKIRECSMQLMQHTRAIKAARTPQAKNLARGRARHVLQRKKMLEKQLAQTQGMQFNMERVGFAIETAEATKDQVAVMKSAATTLKGQLAEVSLDDLEDVQDDLAEMLADADEVQELISESFGMDDAIDDADLDDELAALEAEGLGDLDAELEGMGLDAAGAGYSIEDSLPAVPLAGDAVPAAGGGGRVPVAEEAEAEPSMLH